MMWQKNLLRIDSTAGLVVGVFVLSLFPILGPLYGMSTEMVIAMGVANVSYGCYSFMLARRPVRPRGRLLALIVANGTWSVLCIVTALLMSAQLTVLGMGTLLFEAVFVGTLAVLEWRARPLLEGSGR
jgi:hypothetical protein